MWSRKEDIVLVLLIATLVFVNKAKGDYDETCETPAHGANTCFEGKYLGTDNGCQVCPEGHFQNISNHECRQCKKCTECGDGKVVNHACSLNEDTACKNDTTPSTVSNYPTQPIRTAPAGPSEVTVMSTIPTSTASGNVSTDVNFQSVSSFPVGNMTVQYTFVDGAGNSAFCVFDVIVTATDTTPSTVSNYPTQPIRTAPAGPSEVTVMSTIPTSTASAKEDKTNWKLIAWIFIPLTVVLIVALAGSISFHCKPEWKETVMVKLCGRNREAENGDGRNHQVENGDGRNLHHDLENGNVDTTEMSTFLQPNGQP